MAKVIISTKQLSRQFFTYRKAAGLIPALKQFFRPDPEAKTALKPLDLEITEGQIVGLIGSNGAGKTTLLKLLSGLIHPSSGTAEVLGYTPWERHHSFLKKISLLLGQKNQLWWDIPAADSFQLLITIYDLKKSEALEKINALADQLDCRHVLHVPLRRLSLGERMKMELIGSLLHSPQILFLDEPTIGLDILAQNNIRKFILEELKGRGVTIILTSHYMDDIAQLADRLLVMSRGSIVYDGTVNKFMSERPTKKRLIVDFNEPLPHPLILTNEVTVPKESCTLDHSFTTNELLDVLKTITIQGIVQDLKIEEPDFEDVIRGFFENDQI